MMASPQPIGQAASVRRLASVALALVLAVGVTPLAAPERVAAVTFGSPGPIVYAMYDTDGNQHLWTCMPGGEPVPIPGTFGARAGRWSPDGRVIVFNVWGDGIYLINPDGSGRREIADWIEGEIYAEPIWSTDGTKIAFTVMTPAVTGETFEIQIVDSVGGSMRIETGLDHVWDWLADGTFIGGAWRYVVPGDPSTRNLEIAVQAPDGTRTFLTDTPTIWEGAPRVSPDEQRIAFNASTLGMNITYDLGVMDIDGGNVRYHPLGTQVTWPAWSPNGTEIAIGPQPEAIRPDFTGRRPLINGRASGDGIDWAPLAGTIPEPPPLEGIRTAALKDPSTRTNTTVAATSIWPTVDGYRDTVGITQRLYEPARATLSIYGPSGSLVRRIAYKFDTGVATYTWNGRSSTGAILAAGRYRLVTTSKDLAGNTKVLTRYVTLYRGRH
jgi:hypothetical protein